MSCSVEVLYVGSRPTVVMTFTSDADPPVAANPTSIAIRVLPPTGAVAAYATPNAAITNPAVGTWRFQFPAALTLVGEYWVHVVGSGGGVDIASQIAVPINDVHVPLA